MLNRIIDIGNKVSSIEGWLSFEEGAALYRYARIAPIPTVVEVGSWMGKSTSWLSFAIQDRGSGSVYAVDHWQGSVEHQDTLKGFGNDQLYNTFLNNLRSLNLLPYVKPIKSNSIEASRQWLPSNEIGLIFIDASHDYLSVRRDFEYWCPLVAQGGFIVFHDVFTIWPGPTKLVLELPKWIKHVEQAGACWIGQKITP